MIRWVVPLLFLGAIGCATSHDVQISTHPSDAIISVDGVRRGRGPLKETFTFATDAETHVISASRLGYKDVSLQVGRDFDRDSLLMELKPRSKRVTFIVTPVPGTVSVDGKPVSPDPISQGSYDLDFAVDDKGDSATHTVTAERPGYKKAEAKLNWSDPDPNYTLALDAVRKDLSITTTPAGATVILNGESLGTSPINYSGYPFPVNPDTNEWVPQKLKIAKPGFDPVETSISWDGGKSDYHIDLIPHTKTVRILSNPRGAEIKIDGAEVTRDAAGISTAKLVFSPINEKGDLKSYSATASKTDADSQWVPLPFAIRWDEGKTDYPIALKEIKTRPVNLSRVRPVHEDHGWQLAAETVATIGMKDVGDGPDFPKAVKITDQPRGTMIDALTVSPDGSQVLFTILSGRATADLRSAMLAVNADGSGGVTNFGDGKFLDMTPSYTPDGSQIVFASNRGGKRMSVWEMSAVGDPAMNQLTSGDENDLWPSVDSDPKPRLLYEALIDTRLDARLFMTQLGSNSRTDLTREGGIQPRISPKADSILYTAISEKNGKRRIYRVPDRGGVPTPLTNDADADEFDATWSRDGNRIAYVSDRGTDEDGRNNYDIWVLDVDHPEHPIRITANGSWDDCPSWDPSGRFIYFRSNRGGDWAIWKIAVK